MPTRLSRVGRRVLTRIKPAVKREFLNSQEEKTSESHCVPQIRHPDIWTLQSGHPALFFVVFSELDLAPTPVQTRVQGAEV